MKYIIRYIVLCVTIFVLAQYLPGFSITANETLKTVIISAALILVLDVVIKPVISFFTLPLNIMSLGIFSLVINSFLLWIVALNVTGFDIKSFWVACIASIVISIITRIFGSMD